MPQNNFSNKLFPKLKKANYYKLKDDYLCINIKYLIMSSQTTVDSPIKISESALKQLIRIREEQKVPAEYGLRVGVKGGGCSGFSYILGFDEAKDKDTIYDYDGLTVLMEKSHGIYLLGMEIDWLEGLNNRGFVFNNPNASDTCGCGTSFSA